MRFLRPTASTRALFPYAASGLWALCVLGCGLRHPPIHRLGPQSGTSPSPSITLDPSCCGFWGSSRAGLHAQMHSLLQDKHLLL